MIAFTTSTTVLPNARACQLCASGQFDAAVLLDLHHSVSLCRGLETFDHGGDPRWREHHPRPRDIVPSTEAAE